MSTIRWPVRAISKRSSHASPSSAACSGYGPRPSPSESGCYRSPPRPRSPSPRSTSRCHPAPPKTGVPTDLLNRQLNAVEAELRGLGIAYRELGNPVAPGGFVDQAGGTVCRTQPAGGSLVRVPVLLAIRYSCATSGHVVPEDLIGKQLDVAEAELRTLHINYRTIDGSHSMFGILEPSNWAVCQIEPAGGKRVIGPVDLFAQEISC